MTKCAKHHKNLSVALCTMCGKPVCIECRVKLVDRDYCQSCADDIVRDGAVVALRKLYEIMEEKRKHHRLHVLIPIEYIPVGKESGARGIIHNISNGGLGILADKPCDINDALIMNFRLNNGSKLEAVQGGIVRCEKIGEKYNIGVLFMNMQEKQKLIDDFMYNVKKKKYSETNGFDMSSFVV